MRAGRAHRNDRLLSASTKTPHIAHAVSKLDRGDDWSIKLLYDSLCPICVREVNMLGKRDQMKKIAFIDIADPNYNPRENADIDFHTAMGAIHAIRRDGTVLTGIEAFRATYEAVGLGWIYSLTRLRPIGAVAEFVYSIWARHRLWMTGRPPLESTADRSGATRCK